ncbi:type II toxin-antitoxin system HipA family toxin [Roseateles sp.]|uniref:type II toxin-antitoxin system HipA family toxin n=1 Tax=Roseateles sp. TaxID=1971397 RepID=UPI002F3E4541
MIDVRAGAQQLAVFTPEGLSGHVRRDGNYLFTFTAEATAEHAPALTMPLRARPYEQPTLHPVFHMNLPEGFVLEQLRNRLAKTAGLDPLLLLSVIGSQAPIGRLRYTLAGHDQPSPREPGEGERLADLLAARGTRELFARLVDDYVMRSGISGVQPKVLVPERGSMDPEFKAALSTSDLIVKSGLGEFPGLSINEFVCMTAVQRAGVPVPEFFLSNDGELFIMRRFDRPADGRVLGFEDMLSLSGKAPDQKYSGSYEQIRRLLTLFCAPRLVRPAVQQLFDMVVLSCILGNGDAHLKNFGVLYDRISGEVGMAPAYDIVCTRVYIREDNLALNLDGNKSFFASRLGLLEFGQACNMTRAQIKARVIELATIVLTTLNDLTPLVAKVGGMKEIIEIEARRFLETFER